MRRDHRDRFSELATENRPGLSYLGLARDGNTMIEVFGEYRDPSELTIYHAQEVSLSRIRQF